MHVSTVIARVSLAGVIALGSVNAHAQALTAPTESSTPVADTARHHSWLPTDFGFALGPGIGWQRYADEVSGRNTFLTAVGGFFRGAKVGPESAGGFVPAFKVTLFPNKVAAVAAADPSATVLGTIKRRPVMVGLGWFHPIGKTVAVRLTGLGGWSFNGLGSAEDGKDKPQLKVASSPTAVGSNATGEVSGTLWFNSSPDVSFITGVSFVHARPRLTFANGSTRDWNADHIRLDAGVAFTLFRWHRGPPRK